MIRAIIDRRRMLAGAAFAWLLAAAASAATSGSPALTIEGGGSLTLEALAALPQHEIRTETQYTEGMIGFSGPLARSVLTPPAGATVAVMTAINDYVVEIPLEDFTTWDVILATHMNGKPLSRRDKGPIWVMYPVSDNPELQSPIYDNRLIWQLKSVAYK